MCWDDSVTQDMNLVGTCYCGDMTVTFMVSSTPVHDTHLQGGIDTVFIDTVSLCAGLSERGVQRKATCRALFSKMLYLTEEENLLPSDNKVFNIQELRNVRPYERISSQDSCVFD